MFWAITIGLSSSFRIKCFLFSVLSFSPESIPSFLTLQHSSFLLHFVSYQPEWMDQSIWNVCVWCVLEMFANVGNSPNWYGDDVCLWNRRWNHFVMSVSSMFFVYVYLHNFMHIHIHTSAHRYTNIPVWLRPIFHHPILIHLYYTFWKGVMANRWAIDRNIVFNIDHTFELCFTKIRSTFEL